MKFITDLNKIDLKDIDVMKLKDQLLERKDVMIQIGIGLVSFMVILSSFNKGQAEIKGLKTKMKVMQSKTDSIADYNKVRLEVDAFLKGVPPPMSEDQIVSFVTDLAEKNKIKILTFSPTKSEEKGAVTTTLLQFSLQAGDYKNMVRMIAEIERAKNLLQVKACSVQPALANKLRKNESPLITFRIDVASVKPKL